jgi:hypothetical protein
MYSSLVRAFGNLVQESALQFGCVIHARGNTVGDQIHQELFFASWGMLQELD